MIKIKMTYDEESEVKELLKAINSKMIVEKTRNITGEKRQRLILWGNKKE